MTRPLSSKPRVKLDARSLQVRAVADAAIVDIGGGRVGINVVVARAAAAIERVRNGAGSPYDLTSTSAGSWDSLYAEALAAMDEVEEVVRPALEHGRRLAAQLAADLTAEEAERAAVLEEQRRAAAFEDEVQREVQSAEQRRLQKIEADARKRLATTGAH